jgi:(R,R)-butanediol dehydrogenase/meso-butanediol dehydrogenase/diacetyl reductase
VRAARWQGRRNIQIVDSPRPTPSARDALIAVDWVGLCGSDVEEYVEGPVVIDGEVILGHEIVGTVAAAAADGSGPPLGTRVVVDVVTGCGHCYWCHRHEEGLCPQLIVTGQHVDGGLAEYVVARADRLIPIPDSLSSRHAALAEPLSVAVRAVRKAGPLLGKSVVVVGGGAIGMLTTQVAVASGAGVVLVLEPNQIRRELLGRWATASVWSPDARTRASEVAAQMPGRGADVVFECSGRSGMAAEAIRLTRRGGTVVLLGVTPDAEQIDTLDLVLGEKCVVGSAAHMWDDDVTVAVAMLASGAVDVDAMISAETPLEDIAAAFESLLDPTRDLVKLLVHVGNTPAGTSKKEAH